MSTCAVSARTCRTRGAKLTKPLCNPLCCELNLYAAQYRPERIAPAGQKGGMKRQPAAVEVGEEEEEVVMLGGGSTDDSDEEEEKSVNYDMWGALDSATATAASSCKTKPPTAYYICCKNMLLYVSSYCPVCVRSTGSEFTQD